MRLWAVRIGFSLGLVLVLLAPARAEELVQVCSGKGFTLTCYLAIQEDVCARGYQQASKGTIFTAANFEDLKRRRRLRALGIFRNIIPVPASTGSLNAIVELDQDALSLARSCGASSGLAALLVVEWQTLQGTLRNRRSFDHGNLCGLDPEQGYRWAFSAQKKNLNIVFQ